jgi:cytochrome b involved in lipid metabolism
MSSDVWDTCDACPYCDDRCSSEKCATCSKKPLKQRKGDYTLCQIARHNYARSCWLAADGMVFDATEFMSSHPAGQEPIMKRAGKDCTDDYFFHSRVAQQKCKFACMH